MFVKDNTAWVSDAAQEPELMNALRSGSRMTLQATSARGTRTIYDYSLSGVTAALERVARCSEAGLNRSRTRLCYRASRVLEDGATGFAPCPKVAGPVRASNFQTFAEGAPLRVRQCRSAFAGFQHRIWVLTRFRSPMGERSVLVGNAA